MGGARSRENGEAVPATQTGDKQLLSRKMLAEMAFSLGGFGALRPGIVTSFDCSPAVELNWSAQLVAGIWNSDENTNAEDISVQPLQQQQQHHVASAEFCMTDSKHQMTPAATNNEEAPGTNHVQAW